MGFQWSAQHTRGRAAMRVIVAAGVVVFAFCLVAAVALRRGVGRKGSEQPADAGNLSPFSGDRAYADLERVVAIGPRVSGSPALATLRGLIRSELEQAGLEVQEQTFMADTPIGPRKMVNLWGVVQGTQPGVILIGNHYETKYFPEFTFVGANDAGSTTAWMIEMARALGPRRKGRSIWLAFFDGEEAFKDWSETDSLYGSRAFVEHLRSRRELTNLHVMINVDMIGDRYLGLKRDMGAPSWLVLAIWNKARELGYGKHFQSGTLNVEDDHVPFRLAGIPSIDLIDFEYGGSPFHHRQTWHTPEDTLDKVSAQSLQVIGDVVYHALPEIESWLDASMQVSRGAGS